MRYRIQVVGWTLVWCGVFLFGYLGWQLYVTDWFNAGVQEEAAQQLEADLSDEEREYLAWLDGEVWGGGRGYADLQSNRPDTLASGLSDSPAGLAAWVVEKLREWSDGGLTIAQELVPVTLFWLTNSISTSFRAYADDHAEPPLPLVTVPAAVVVQRHERGFPRSLAERTYVDIRSFTELEHGGHFTATEAPQEIAAVVRGLARDVGLLPGS